MATPYTLGMDKTATYWPPGVPAGFGKVTFGGAVYPVACRWQDEAVLFRDTAGEQVVSESVVYVGQRVENKGYIALGEHSAADPTTVSGAREIRQVGISPALVADTELTKVYL